MMHAALIAHLLALAGLAHAQEWVEPTRFSGRIVSVAAGKRHLVVQTETARLRLIVRDDKPVYMAEINGCPAKDIGDLKTGWSISGGFDRGSNAIRWWKSNPRRDRKAELKSQAEQCVTGRLVATDVGKRFLQLEGMNGDKYEFIVDPHLEIWCYGDLSIRRRFEDLPSGMQLFVKYKPQSPLDLATKISGLHCGGR